MEPPGFLVCETSVCMHVCVHVCVCARGGEVDQVSMGTWEKGIKIQMSPY